MTALFLRLVLNVVFCNYISTLQALNLKLGSLGHDANFYLREAQLKLHSSAGKAGCMEGRHWAP